MSSLNKALVLGQIAQGVKQTTAQIQSLLNLINNGRPAITQGPQQAPAITAADVAEAFGDDLVSIKVAAEAYVAALTPAPASASVPAPSPALRAETAAAAADVAASSQSN